MSKFNGPWAYYVEESIDHDLNGHERGDPFVNGYNIVDSEGNDVVGCEGILSDGEHYARLIASAPDLVVELRQAIIQMEMAAECIEKGRYDEALLHASSLMRSKKEVLAKATGESA